MMCSAAQAFSFPLPDPYFQSIYPDFKNGVNFAFSGAKAVLQPLGPSTPSVLQQQLNQFSYFKNVSLTATGKPGTCLIAFSSYLLQCHRTTLECLSYSNSYF
eukprot:c27994_g1_i4 orf=158-463(+)